MKLKGRASEDGWTANMLAALHNQFDAVRALVELGADPTATDNHGFTV